MFLLVLYHFFFSCLLNFYLHVVHKILCFKLKVYTPWCFDCEATSKQIEKLARHFKGLENFKFARIDASSNEHPKLQVWNLSIYIEDNNE